MKILSVVGARPNFMKIAPFLREIAASGHPGLSHVLVHTGQHYDHAMSEVFFRELGIQAPDENLQVGSGSHASQTAKVMLAFEPICLREKPDWVVVVGDVNSTMACTLVAAKLGIKVAHIEAGLRSFDRAMPEEINRIVTDALSDLLFTPSDDADENLQREGVPAQKIVQVGNIMIDALVTNLDQASRSDVLRRFGIEKGAYAYVTLHRPSNVDDPASLAQVLDALDRVSRLLPVVFPMHPRTRGMLARLPGGEAAVANLEIVEPVGYHESLCLTANARFVLTDSGGIQEESTYLRVPCLTLRANTERPVTVTVGTNKLTTARNVLDDVAAIMEGRHRTGSIPRNWDGKTAGRILQALIDGRNA